jgi:hypothetical protein
MITGRYILGDDKCTIEDLEKRMVEGQCVFPKEIMFSRQGIDFLNRLLCFNEE